MIVKRTLLYPGHSLWVVPAEVQSVYSADPDDWAKGSVNYPYIFLCIYIILKAFKKNLVNYYLYAHSDGRFAC